MNNQRPDCGHTSLILTCTACKQFQSHWDNLLESEGIFNLEQDDGNLKSWASSMANRDVKRGQIEAMRSREEYYRAAGHFLWDHEFANETERRIWELHANGIGAVEISKTLQVRKLGRSTIIKIINKLAHVMGIKCRS